MKECPQAEIEVKTDWYTGNLHVVCMNRCIYDLVIGNDIHTAEGKTRQLIVDKNKPSVHKKCVYFENSNL